VDLDVFEVVLVVVPDPNDSKHGIGAIGVGNSGCADSPHCDPLWGVIGVSALLVIE